MTICDMEKLVEGRIGKDETGRGKEANSEGQAALLRHRWMEEMFGDIDPKDIRSWMEGMGSMMERHCCATGSGVARWMLKR